MAGVVKGTEWWMCEASTLCKRNGKRNGFVVVLFFSILTVYEGVYE